MYKIALLGGALSILGLLWANAHFAEPVEVIKEVEEAIEEQPVEQIDVVDAAAKELERINNELDAEETRLLEEAEAIDARLDEIRSIRASFQ